MQAQPNSGPALALLAFYEAQLGQNRMPCAMGAVRWSWCRWRKMR